ncbi:uncharacterized protein E1O_19030 [Burkholderiales bacterium GJ-E10]|nr:uncharacterized protein E1O_19030 [Burkholderiales bacterium GJ-E10]
MNIDPSQSRQRRVTWLTLFAPTGTLICCALPIPLAAVKALAAEKITDIERKIADLQRMKAGLVMC